jgi:hypothetical protein
MIRGSQSTETALASHKVPYMQHQDRLILKTRMLQYVKECFYSVLKGLRAAWRVYLGRLKVGSYLGLQWESQAALYVLFWGWVLPQSMDHERCEGSLAIPKFFATSMC